ncbi:MAG: hypothetical protein IJK64_03810 [Clostridia bacterium]|nr:hypothetical protein [Clostridia bacterium]
MKEILLQARPLSRRLLLAGTALCLLLAAVSAVLYFCAGRTADYFASIALSETLLTAVRPLAVLTAAAAVYAEYRARSGDAPGR